MYFIHALVFVRAQWLPLEMLAPSQGNSIESNLTKNVTVSIVRIPLLLSDFFASLKTLIIFNNVQSVTNCQ